MPLAFLVKRKKCHSVYKTYRAKNGSEDDRSDSGSEQENVYLNQPHGSPDSGYSTHSPLSLTFKDAKIRHLLSYYHDSSAATDLRIGSKRLSDENDSISEKYSKKQNILNAYTSITKALHSPQDLSNANTKEHPKKDILKRPPIDSRDGSRFSFDHLGFNNNSDTFQSGLNKNYPRFDRTIIGGGLNGAILQEIAQKSRLADNYKQEINSHPEEEAMVIDTARPESTCSSSSRSSPLSRVDTPTPQQGSPFYFTNFDGLSVSSPHRNSLTSPPYPAFQPPTPKTPSTPGTPLSPSRKRASPIKDNNDSNAKTTKAPKKTKAMRKIKFDLEDKSSPVSGTFIRDDDDIDVVGATVVCGDIDGSLNMVEMTPEARQELEKIENKIGDFICQLCKEFYPDAFLLAQHKCSRIVHIEYRCPECDKVFNCPANLASHRRWHKPRPNGPKNGNNNSKTDKSITLDSNGQKQTIIEGTTHCNTPSPSNESNEGLFECDQCGKKFKRQAYLKKHLASHLSQEENGNKPYPCQFCGKVLRSETARAKHVLQHAVGNKDLACEVCGNCFPNKPALDRHMRMHNSEVYTCKYCTSTFYSSPGLTRHINKCHPSENRQVILLQMPVTRPC